MNYLAHCFLAETSSESLVGNLLGDFCKGVDEKTLTANIYAGLLNHREVDRFTDSHPLVQQAKSCFSPQRRRFASIALDVLFDHFLIKNWHLYSDISFIEFKFETYQLLVQGSSLMPARMKLVMASVVKNDWFASYESVDGIGLALDRIANRIRFKNNFKGSIEDINRHYQPLDDMFKQFFPQLLAFNRASSLNINRH